MSKWNQRIYKKVILVLGKLGNEPKPNLMFSTLSCSLGALFSWESKRRRRMWVPLHRLRLTLCFLTCHLNSSRGANLSIWVGKYSSKRLEWPQIQIYQCNRIFVKYYWLQYKCNLIFKGHIRSIYRYINYI